MEIALTVSGQDRKEINDAIDKYKNLHDELNKKCDDIYISFGNNLVSAELVANMLIDGFTPTWHTMTGIDHNNIELVFRK